MNTLKKITKKTNIRVILSGMSTTGFLASSSRRNSLDGALQNITKLKGLNEVTESSEDQFFTCVDSCLRVPNHAPVFDTDIVEALVDLTDLLNTLVKGLLGPVRRNR